MIVVLSFLVIIILGLVFPLAFCFYGIYCIWGDIKGAPYVPTSDIMVDQILAKANLRKGQFFLELGSGDGRVTREAVKKYGVRGKGVDVHLGLIWWSNLISRIQGLKNIEFKAEDLFKTDIRADVLFLFLLPKTLKKLAPKLEKDSKGALIISHGFEIEGFEKYLKEKINRKLFPTYYYVIPRR